MGRIGGACGTRRLAFLQLPPLPRHRNMSASATILLFDPQSTTSSDTAAKLLANTPQADSEKPLKVGTTRTFYNTPNNRNVTTITSLGGGFREKKGPERREVVRKSIGSAVKELKSLGGVKNVTVDASLDSHAVGK